MKWRVIQEVYGRRKTVAKDLTRAQAENIVASWSKMDRTIKRKNVRYQIIGNPVKKTHAPPGFISGPHMHDPRDPSVYYAPAAIKKAIHSRANPKFTRYLTKTGRLTKSKKHRTRLSPWAVKRLDKARRSGHLSPQEFKALEHALREVSGPDVKRKRRRNPAQHWYIHVQKHGRGPVMLWNGVSFSDPRNRKPLPFASANSAMYKARHLLGQYKIMSKYKIWVSDMFHGAPTVDTRVNPRRRKNPSHRNLDEAAQKLEDFTGREATHVERASARSNDKTGLVLGELNMVSYLAAREGIDGGRMADYRHKFRKGSRPLLAVSTDGKQLHVVGGQYEFTEAGIEDR